MILLITGGSGSGKSVWAEKTAQHLCPGTKFYLATMQSPDPESDARIRRHRMQRAPFCFETVECPVSISKAEIPQDSTVLLEDIPNLLANEMFGGGDFTGILPDICALSQICRHLIMVTNDVFSDGIRYPDATQLYMERLARINRKLASLSDTVVEVVYSIPVLIKGSLSGGTV